MEEEKNYLTYHCLFGPYNYRRTIDRVREIYFELYTSEISPRACTIAEIMDEENLITIQEYCYAKGYDREDHDEIEKMYVEEISCTLDDCVEMMLANLGYQFTSSALSAYNPFYPTDQVILVPELVPRSLRII